MYEFRLDAIESRKYIKFADAWNPETGEEAVVCTLRFAQVKPSPVLGTKLGRVRGWPIGSLELVVTQDEAARFELGKLYGFEGVL